MQIVVTFAIMSAVAVAAIRMLVIKTKLTEKSIDAAIARRLRTSPAAEELRDLRELNGVMRNLLTDLVENEDIRPPLTGGDLPREDRKRLLGMREARRREIFAEALVLLRQTGPVSRVVKTKRIAE
jgi:hypothetical protein